MNNLQTPPGPEGSNGSSVTIVLNYLVAAIINQKEKMTYQVLARKWRPKIFDDVIGQDHIVRSLQNVLKSKDIQKNYLFTGTRGVGKTTVARILAKSIRCLDLKPNGNPCLICSSCEEIENSTSMDFIEIDGASNNGVDNVRTLIENIQYLPTQGHYKIYLIDEVHMLSTSAFNALLKTLEEPPKHVVFIFATTESAKIPETIHSRFLRFDFKNVTLNELIKQIEKISLLEGIKFQHQKTLKELCRQGKGSVRDTLSLLDQVLTYCEDKLISDDYLTISLGLAKTSALKNLLSGVIIGDSVLVSKTFKEIIGENIDLNVLASSLLNNLYEILTNLDNVQKIYEEEYVNSAILDTVTPSELFWVFESMTKDLDWALKSLDPTKVFEVVLLKITMRRTFFQSKKK